MRVKFLSSGIESAALPAVIGQRELTRMWRTSTLAREDTYSSWTNGRKDCVSQPRGCHRGVFSESRQEQVCERLHPYRRINGQECFVTLSENFVLARNNHD